MKSYADIVYDILAGYGQNNDNVIYEHDICHSSIHTVQLNSWKYYAIGYTYYYAVVLNNRRLSLDICIWRYHIWLLIIAIVLNQYINYYLNYSKFQLKI